MRQVAHTLIDHVRAPMDKVFALLTDPKRMPEWLPGCSGVEVDGPVRKGTRLRPSFGSRRSEFEIVDYAPPNTFGWIERGQRKGSKTFFRLEFSGGATAVTIRDLWTPSSFLGWVRGRFLPKRNVQKQMKAMLENLQKLAGDHTR
jgi:uncharacterized protein YndB with AHSA1/START domain